MYASFHLPVNLCPSALRYLDSVRPVAEKLLSEPLLALPYTAFRLYSTTGSRVEYENAYMDHRKRLCAFSGMLVSEPENPKWLDALCDTLFAVCDEYTWALPAHIPNIAATEAVITHLDLFSCETSMALAEIVRLFGNILPECVLNRVKFEVTRRTVRPYLNNPDPRFGVSNWSAVCGGAIGCTMIALGLDEAFEAAQQKIMNNMSDFLMSFTDDGCCLEGSLYWSYGFGFFTYFAETLREYTNGTLDFFADEKVRSIAHFAANTSLGGSFVLSFSDAPHTLKLDRALMNILANIYDDIPVPDESALSVFGDDTRYRFAPFIRNLLSAPPIKNAAVRQADTVFYPDGAWYINRKYGYTLAAKGGHNDEPHNHNDIGSFLVFDGGAFILDDVGWSSYNRDYFDHIKRYQNPCASSSGHGVPLIDGETQKAGRSRHADILAADGTRFAIEYAAAYDLPALRSLRRTFTPDERGVTVTEEADGTFSSFVYRYATRIKPVIDGKTVRIASWTLTCDHDVVPTVSSFTFTPRFSGLDGDESENETAYLINFAFGVFDKAVFRLEKDR